MPQSLSAVYIHLVFSTKNRQPFLRDKDMRTTLHSQIGGIGKTLGCPPILIGGVEDHLHLLAAFWSHDNSSRMDQRTKAGVEPLVERRVRALGFCVARWLRGFLGE